MPLPFCGTCFDAAGWISSGGGGGGSRSSASISFTPGVCASPNIILAGMGGGLPSGGPSSSSKLFEVVKLPRFRKSISQIVVTDPILLSSAHGTRLYC